MTDSKSEEPSGQQTPGDEPWRAKLAQPLVAGLACAALALPARALGHEVAQAFRRLVDRVVSRSDTLFEYATGSPAAADQIRAFQAWGAWIVSGLVAGAVAMTLFALLARRAPPWSSLAVTLALWLGVYFLAWRWDGELRFMLSGLGADGGVLFGPWPYAGPVGWFAGFALGLTLAALPWRRRRAA